MSAAVGLDYLRIQRERGDEPQHPVIVSTVGDVCGNLHVHLNLVAHPTDVDWRPVAGLEVIAVVGAGQLKRFVQHAVRLLRYGINQQPGWHDFLYVWNVDKQDGVLIKRWPPVRSVYHELSQPEVVDVMPLAGWERDELRRMGFERA